MSGVEFKHFRWLSTRSAWQDIEYHRARRAEALANDQATMDAVNSAMSTALQNKISQGSNNAAQAALKRLQAVAKAKNDSLTKQIDDTQSVIDQTQKSVSTTPTSGSSTVLSTVA